MGEYLRMAMVGLLLFTRHPAFEGSACEKENGAALNCVLLSGTTWELLGL